MTRLLRALFLLALSSLATAEVLSVTGTVDKLQLMGTEYESYATAGQAIVFIHMNALPKSCGSEFRRVAITSDHPAFEVVVASVLAAKAAQQTITMYYVNECTLWNNNAWDFSMVHIL